MKFNDVLNKYINLIGCSSKDIAKYSNLSESIISRYKSGNRIPNNENLKKISESLSILSEEKYKKEEIFNEFNKTINNTEIDFEVIRCNLNKLIVCLDINASELAKFLNFDASYLSRIRNGNRIPSNKQGFINELTSYIVKKYSSDAAKKSLSILFNCNINEINEEKIKNWILNNKIINDNQIDKFFKNLDNFNLNDYIKAIKFDELKVPYIPFYKAKTKSYYGIEEMKKGELDFLKGTVLSKSMENMFMCSDMPMEDMASDIKFGKNWMFGIAMCLKKGLHLNIIHNLDRPFNEMMLGLESWIPIYMTGQITPYYLKNNKTNIYNHLNYVSGSVALMGECINGSHERGKYYLTANNKEVEYYKEKSELLLKKANSLMNIYREEQKEEYKLFLLNDTNIKGNRKRIFSSLPLFTINDELLIKILKRNNIPKDDINNILLYKNEEEKNIKLILKNNEINDIIYSLNKNDFNDVYLQLENIFYTKKIKYNYEEYLEHLNSTKKYAKNLKNYNITINDYKIFNNINITILKDNYVILSKSSNPIIHFVIRHPKLVEAIENFNPTVKE